MPLIERDKMRLFSSSTAPFASSFALEVFSCLVYLSAFSVPFAFGMMLMPSYVEKERWRVKALRKAPRMEMNWVGSRAMVLS